MYEPLPAGSGIPNPSVTLRVYSQALGERDRAAASRIGGLLASPTEQSGRHVLPRIESRDWHGCRGSTGEGQPDSSGLCCGRSPSSFVSTLRAVIEPKRAKTVTRGRRTQAERRAATRAALLRAAGDLIGRKGVAATSLAEIGDSAGYSHASVNHEFGSKAALIEELVATVELQFRDRLDRRNRAESGLAAALRLADIYVDLGGEDQSLSRVSVMLWAEAVFTVDLRSQRRRLDRRTRAGLASYLQRGIEDGSIRSLDAEGTAVVILGMLRGALLQITVDPDRLSQAQTKSALHDALEAMLKPR